MERICQKCHKTYSSRQSLWNHKKYCKGETSHHSVPYEPETVMGTDVKRQYDGAGKVQIQQHSKTLNPKFSALIDSIVDEEHSPKKKKKTLTMNELFLPRDDLTPKVDVDDDITDTDTDDNETEDEENDCNPKVHVRN